jgi:hypothetical protein
VEIEQRRAEGVSRRRDREWLGWSKRVRSVALPPREGLHEHGVVSMFV